MIYALRPAPCAKAQLLLWLQFQYCEKATPSSLTHLAAAGIGQHLQKWNEAVEGATSTAMSGNRKEGQGRATARRQGRQ